jgi:hypothetical protein
LDFVVIWHEGKEIKNYRRDSTNEARRVVRSEAGMKREDMRSIQYKRRDDTSSEERSATSNTATTLQREEYASLNPKYFDTMKILSNAPEYFLNIRNLMKVGRNTFLENIDSTLFTQVLLGGMTMALMWNKKQVHGGF